MANKEVAYKLGTSERTVKAHRATDHGEDECRILRRLGPFRREAEAPPARPLTFPKVQFHCPKVQYHLPQSTIDYLIPVLK